MYKIIIKLKNEYCKDTNLILNFKHVVFLIINTVINCQNQNIKQLW